MKWNRVPLFLPGVHTQIVFVYCTIHNELNIITSTLFVYPQRLIGNNLSILMQIAH